MFFTNFILRLSKSLWNQPLFLCGISRNSFNPNLSVNLYFLILCVETEDRIARRATIPIIPRPLSLSFTLISAQTKPIKVAREFSSQSGSLPLNNTNLEDRCLFPVKLLAIPTFGFSEIDSVSNNVAHILLLKNNFVDIFGYEWHLL